MAAYDLNPHAWMFVPMDRVELNKACGDRPVEVGMLNSVRIGIPFENLPSTERSDVVGVIACVCPTQMVLFLQSEINSTIKYQERGL